MEPTTTPGAGSGQQRRKVRSAEQAGGTGVLLVAMFGGDGEGAKAVNSFLKNFCSQERYGLAVGFAKVRMGAGGVFGARVGDEKKAS